MQSAPPSSLTPTLRTTAPAPLQRRAQPQLQQPQLQRTQLQRAAPSERPEWLSRTLTTALGALRFTAMTVVGMVAVWALVLLFG